MTHQLPMKPDPPVTSTVPFPLMVAPPPLRAARTKPNQPAVSTVHQTYIESSSFQPCVMPPTLPCPPMPGWSRAFTMSATPLRIGQDTGPCHAGDLLARAGDDPATRALATAQDISPGPPCRKLLLAARVSSIPASIPASLGNVAIAEGPSWQLHGRAADGLDFRPMRMT